MNKEGLADIYFDKVTTAEDPSLELVKFYSELCKLPIDAKQKVTFDKLIRVYGVTRVFFGVLSLGLSTGLAHKKHLENLLKKIVRESFEREKLYGTNPKLDNVVDTLEDMKEAVENKDNNLKLRELNE